MKIPSYAKASEGYPPLAKSAEATSFNTSIVEAQVTHSSTGRARGLLRRRITTADTVTHQKPFSLQWTPQRARPRFLSKEERNIGKVKLHALKGGASR